MWFETCNNVFHLFSFHTTELNHFVIDLDEEVVGMQSTICALQQQLKEAKQELAIIKQTPQKSDSSEVATSSMPPPAPAEPVEQSHERTIKEERTEWNIKEEKKDEIKKEWTREQDAEAHTFSQEPSRQSGEVSEETSWTAYEKAASPSTPTEEEEAFRIPEAPKTVEMAPNSPAIPEEASSAPGPQEEARTSSSMEEEQPMDAEPSWIKTEVKMEVSERERTFQVPPQQPEEQVYMRTTDGTPPPPPAPVPETNSTASDERDRTQDDKMEMSATEENQQFSATAAAVGTPMESEPVPEPTAAQESQDNQVRIDVTMEKAAEGQEQQTDRTGDAEAKDGNQVEVSNSQGVEDSNAATPIEATNGNTRTEENAPDQGIETGSTNHNTKNGEFSPAHPVSPPQSSDSNNQDLVKSNCTNSPSSNNTEEYNMSQTTEDGTDTNSSEALHNCDSVAVPTTDRTNSPVKQVVVKSNDGDGLTGGGDNEEKGHDQAIDIPPLKENGPETVESN